MENTTAPESPFVQVWRRTGAQRNRRHVGIFVNDAAYKWILKNRLQNGQTIAGYLRGLLDADYNRK